MSTEANKAVVLKYFLESHNPPYNLDIMDEMCSPEYAEIHKGWQRMELAALPDKIFTIEHIIAEADNVVLHWTLRGTHLGEIMTPVGQAVASGNAVTMTGMAIYQIANGKIVHEWNSHDWLGALMQIGAEIKVQGQTSGS